MTGRLRIIDIIACDQMQIATETRQKCGGRRTDMVATSYKLIPAVTFINSIAQY